MPLILAAMIIARNPAQYGLDIEPPPVETPNFEKVTPSVAVDLRRVAEWAGTSVQSHPGAESGASPLDDAGSGDGLRAEGAGGSAGNGSGAAVADSARGYRGVRPGTRCEEGRNAADPSRRS